VKGGGDEHAVQGLGYRMRDSLRHKSSQGLAILCAPMLLLRSRRLCTVDNRCLPLFGTGGQRCEVKRNDAIWNVA
jgi:hypothetical protein